jgi:hypothetical protein
MAYISQHSGTEIDNGISDNATQNNRITNLEQIIANLTNIINNELAPIKNDIDILKNFMNNSSSDIKITALTRNAYNALSTKDANTLYIITD